MVPPVSVLIVSAVPGVVDLNDKFCYSHQRDRKIPKNTHIGRSGFFFLNAPGFSLMSPRSAFRGGTMSAPKKRWPPFLKTFKKGGYENHAVCIMLPHGYENISYLNKKFSTFVFKLKKSSSLLQLSYKNIGYD